MLWARVLADLIVVFHACYVSFVVFGLAAILAGIVFRWGWVRNFWFRAIHLVMIAIVVGESLAGVPCPLTVWEQQLRKRAGEALHGGFPRLLGPSADLLPGGALGLHADLHRLRAGGRGRVRPGAAAAGRSCRKRSTARAGGLKGEADDV